MYCCNNVVCYGYRGWLVDPLQLLAQTTVPLALFANGVFLYGRRFWHGNVRKVSMTHWWRQAHLVGMTHLWVVLQARRGRGRLVTCASLPSLAACGEAEGLCMWVSFLPRPLRALSPPQLEPTSVCVSHTPVAAGGGDPAAQGSGAACGPAAVLQGGWAGHPPVHEPGAALRHPHSIHSSGHSHQVQTRRGKCSTARCMPYCTTDTKTGHPLHTTDLNPMPTSPANH